MCKNILHAIEQHIQFFDSFENIYLYGSILNDSENANDIDILLVYTEFSNSIIDNLKVINSVFADVIELPMHFTVLSREEVCNTQFLKKLNLEYLKLK